MILSSRLCKADRKKYKQTIKTGRMQKVVTRNEVHDISWAWTMLKDDFYRRMRLDLKHVGDYPLKDKLESDSIDGETFFDTKSYLKHFTDGELELTYLTLIDAKRALSYLERLLLDEIERRPNPKWQLTIDPQAGKK